MSNVRYIEVNSLYRDRNRWPIGGEFEIPIAQSGQRPKESAIDPVSLATPLLSWTGNRVDATGGVTVTGTILTPSPSSTQSEFIIEAISGELQQKSDYYNALILQNTTIGDSRRIVDYEFLNTSGGMDRARITVFPSFPDTFSLGDSFSITDSTDLTFPHIFVPCGRDGDNAYFACIIYNESLNQSRNVSGYNDETHLLTVETPIIGWLSTHNYSIRKEQPLVLTIGAATTSTVTLTNGSTNDDFYNGHFIRIRAAVYGDNLTPPEGETRKIVDYDGSSGIATVFPPFPVVPVLGDIEILNFSYDNLRPFVYTGSMVSQQELVCYEIELINLILPNQVLNVGTGSRIAFYPFVYVELSNSTSRTTNIIMSNNPNATRMLFRAPIDDVSNPETTSFINVDGNGMKQTIKFKPNETLKFSVRLPSGEVYDTVLGDYVSPSVPNELSQISALFGIKRL